MPAAQEPVELLQISPFAGLDVTTAETMPALSTLPSPQPNRGVDGSGYVLNRKYGAYVTTQGRQRILTIPVTQTNGLVENSTDPSTPTYLLAGDVAPPFPATGALFSFTPSGTQTRLTLPYALTGGKRTSFIQYSQWTFGTNGTDTPFKVDANGNVTRWGIVAPTVVATSGTDGAGNITAVNPFFYAYTYATATQESSPSPLTGLTGTTASSNKIKVQSLTASTDPQVTTINVYRLGGDSGQAGLWLFVGSVANGVTTYEDNTADGALTGAELITHRDPPQAFYSVCAHKDHIFGFGYAGTAIGEPTGTPATSDIWFSNPYEPWGFDEVNSVIPCGRNSGDDTLQGGTSLGGILLVFKRKSTWVITGNSVADFFVEQLFQLGTAAPKSIVYALGQTFWLDYDTVYSFAGGVYSDIGVLLKDFIFNLDEEDRAAAVGAFLDKTYLLSFPTLAVTWGYDLRAGEWIKYPFAFDQVTYDPSGPGEISEADDIPLLLVASEPNGGNIDVWDATETDLGTVLNSYFVSSVSDCGMPQFTKSFMYGVLYAPPVADPLGQALVKITVTTDPGARTQIVKVIELNLAQLQLYSYIFGIPDVPEGQLVQVRIDVQSDQLVEIDRLSLYGVPGKAFNMNAP